MTPGDPTHLLCVLVSIGLAACSPSKPATPRAVPAPRQAEATGAKSPEPKEGEAPPPPPAVTEDAPQTTWPLPDEKPARLRTIPFGVFVQGDVLLVAGSTNGALMGQAHHGGDDAFVARLRHDSGASLFTHQFGTSTRDVARGVSVSGQFLFLAGTTSGELVGSGAHGYRDGFIQKRALDDGKLIWSVQLGTAANDEVVGVQADKKGNVYVAGSTNGALGGRAPIGKQDTFVQKYSPEGELLWTSQLGTLEDDALVALRLGPGGQPHVLTTHATGHFTLNWQNEPDYEEFQSLVSLDEGTGESRGGLVFGERTHAAPLLLRTARTPDGAKVALRAAEADRANDFALSASNDWLLATGELQEGGTCPSHDGNAPTVQRISAASGQTRWEHDSWGVFSTLIRAQSTSISDEVAGYVLESGIDDSGGEPVYVRKLRVPDGGLVYRANLPGSVGSESRGPLVYSHGHDALVAWSGSGEGTTITEDEAAQVVLLDAATGKPRFSVTLGMSRTAVAATPEPSPLVEFCGGKYSVDQEVNRVVCSQGGVVDLRPLRRLRNLTTLWLEGTHVADLSAITELRSLRNLKLENCGINNLSALAGLAELEELHLARGEFHSLKPLSGLKKVRFLDLSANPHLGSLAPLSQLPALSQLVLVRSPVLDLAPLASVATLSHLEVDDAFQLDVRTLPKLTSLKFISVRLSNTKDLAWLQEALPQHISAWERDDQQAPEDSSLERQEYLRIRDLVCAPERRTDDLSGWECPEN